MNEQIRHETSAAMQIWGLTRQVGNAMYRCREKELSGSGCTAMDTAVLYTLKIAPEGITQAEIARLIFREPNTVTILLRKLEKNGLVQRTKDLERKNLVRVTITKKGEKTLAEAMARWNVIDDIVSCLSDEESIHLRSILLKLHRKSFETLGMSEDTRQIALSMFLNAYNDL
ncbi:MarR family winged helix-turn-helix transcriptional regulator [Chloroflexota bacterium]